MANPSIGSYDFLTLIGNPNPMGESVKDITRPCVDGIAYSKTGKCGAPFTMESARDEDDAADVKTALANYKAYKGTLQTLTLPDGQTYTNVIVLGVERIQNIAITTAAGGLSASATRLHKCRWTLQHTEVP